MTTGALSFRIGESWPIGGMREDDQGTVREEVVDHQPLLAFDPTAVTEADVAAGRAALDQINQRWERFKAQQSGAS